MNKQYIRYMILLPPAALCIAALLLHHKEAAPASVPIPAGTETERLAYLRSEGWEGECICSQAVTVPAKNAVFAEYADLQRSQQLPLEEYTGKQAELYLYSLQNTELYAELLTADGILIGAQCYDPSMHVTLAINGNPPEP